MVPDREIEVPSPLRECFLSCEVHCVRGCCGIEAISTEQEVIGAWRHEAGPAASARPSTSLPR
jgi:hypothetical protein